MCKPPPFPGLVLVILLLINASEITMGNNAPELSSIPPPALFEVLFSITVPAVTISIPSALLSMAPPLPAAPEAVLLVKVEL